MEPLSQIPSEPDRGLTSCFSPCALPRSQHIHSPPAAPDMHPKFWHTHKHTHHDEVRLANVPEKGAVTASSIPGLGHRRRPSWLPLPGCPLSIRPPSSSFKRTARFRDMELTARSYLPMLCTSAPDSPASSNWPGRVVPAQQIPPAPAPTRSEAALRRKVSPPKGRIRLCPPLCTRPLLPQP